MRTIGAAAIASLILAVTVSSSEADFLLNCRLMSPDHAWYDRLCRGELGYSSKLLEDCPPEAACIMRTQNFKGAYEVISSDTVEETISVVENTVAAAVPEPELLTSETGLAASALDGARDTTNAAAP
jgi:hypothetical protein